MKPDTSEWSEIQELVCQVRELADAPENRQILCRWQSAGDDVSVTNGASVWHGVPTARAGAAGTIPFTVDPEPLFYASALRFPLREYYLDPLCYLKNTLRTKIYRHETFDDDSYITKDVSLFLGVVLEPSMFGVQPVYPEDRDPWNDHTPVVTRPEDLETLQVPDFYHAGIMPRCHEFYRVIREALPDDFTVSFPLWGRGPWGVAQHLMGFENLYIATLEEPEFVHALMRKITACQQVWLQNRADFLGIPLPQGAMYNDEVNCKLLSPETYHEFVFPYEQQAARFQNGITYWHSCGDTGPLLPELKHLYGLQMYDCSAWTDWQTAADALRDTEIAVEVRMHPVRDVMFADEAQIRRRLAHVREVFSGMKLTVRADGFQPMGALEDDTEKIRRFARIAAEMLR